MWATAEGKALPYTINYTMMRIDLPRAPGAWGHLDLEIKWWYNVNDRMKDGGWPFRNGVFRLKMIITSIPLHSSFPGWQYTVNVEGLAEPSVYRKIEFALPFGDYQVEITVPSDHVVGATGVLVNADEVL